MNKSKKKGKVKITLEDLYEVTNNSFSKLEGKITGLEREVNGIRGEVGGLRQEMNSRFNEVDRRFDEVISTQDKLLKDVEDLKDEKTMDMAFRDRVEKLENDVQEIKVRLGLNKNRA